MNAFVNWSRNQSATPAQVRTPTSAAEVAQAVRDAARDGRRVRMVGSGHSFTGVALTDGILLRPTALTGVLAAGDGQATGGNWVKVAAGTPLHVLNDELDRRGLALANMGTSPRRRSREPYRPGPTAPANGSSPASPTRSSSCSPTITSTGSSARLPDADTKDA